MDKFLEIQSLNPEEIQEMSRLIFSNKIEPIIKNYQKYPNQKVSQVNPT